LKKTVLGILIAYCLFSFGIETIHGNVWAQNQDNSNQNETFMLPPVKDDNSSLSSAAQVYVKRFKLVGNTIFTEKHLRKEVLKQYEGKKITSEQLQEAKHKITNYYISQGYINSGAVIPDQKVQNNEITIKIIEGKLTKTEVSGTTWLKPKYILSRLAIATEEGKKPLNINVLQDYLKIIKQDPLIENINANLSPGVQLGEAELSVKVDEARPYMFSSEFNNHNSPSIGAYRGDFSFTHINVSGWGDSINASYGWTEGLDNYSIKYSFPINRWGTSLNIDVDQSDSIVVADTFRDFDIKGKTITYGTGFRHPFIKTVSQELAMSLRFEKRRSQTSLLGDDFSFSAGVVDGESNVSVVRCTQEWIDRSLSYVFAFRSTFSIGLDILDSTDIGEGFSKEETGDYQPNGSFATWLGQFQWIQRLNTLNSQLIFRLDLRLSDSPLLPMEKFAIGGYSTVRGYRENQLTPDNGLVSSVEWRIPVINVPVLSKDPKDGLIIIAPFFDYGKGGNTNSEDPEISSISSLGLGVRWFMNKYAYTEIYYGYALRRVEGGPDWDLQDDGVHFLVRGGMF